MHKKKVSNQPSIPIPGYERNRLKMKKKKETGRPFKKR